MRHFRIEYILTIVLLFIGSIHGVTAQTGEEHAQLHIQRNASEYRLSSEDIKSPLFTDSYQSKHNGVFHVYLKQTYEDIPVFNATMNLNINKAGKLLSMHSRFVPDLAQKINTDKPTLSPQEAIYAVAKQLELDLGMLTIKEEKKTTPIQLIFEQNELLRYEPKVSQIFYLMEDGKVRLAWNVELGIKSPLNSWEIQVDAINGNILNTVSRTHRCSFEHSGSCGTSCDSGDAHHKMENVAEPSAMLPLPAPGDYAYNIFDFPVESPNHGIRSVVNTPWTIAGDGGTLGWHNDNTTLYSTTRGNNAWIAYEVDSVTLYSPNPSSSTAFNFPFNTNNSLSDNLDASLTNLFYTNNMMHDVWYQYGFDELSGNFQKSNLGRGGVEGDEVRAGAQDPSGTNNAIFDTPPDGQNGVMQMFTWYYPELLSIDLNLPNNNNTYTAAPALFGPRFPSAPNQLTGQLVLVENIDTVTEVTTSDGGLAIANGYIENTHSACNTISNASALNGKIALIDRGNCLFVNKMRNAQEAGAIACVICNNQDGNPFTMSGDGDDITIPSMMISKSLCDLIKAETNPVTVSLALTQEESSYDASFDNGVVCHEYGHGLSMRLTGGPGNVACLGNSEQMGEGWSDWLGLWMTMKATDTPEQPRGMGTYVNNQGTTDNGLRLKPYSTDFAVNAYTYADLCNPEVLAPHGVGFIWGTMLWDLTWALVDKYGFDEDLYAGVGGNNLAAQLIVDGMKLQPCAPGFVDGRDAIILADEILTGGENECLIWEVFAKRGLGSTAEQGSSYSRCDQTSSFDVPEACTTFAITKNIEIDEIQNGTQVTYSIELTNNMGQDYEDVTLTDVLSNDLTYVPNSSTCPVTVNGQTLTFNLGDVVDEEFLYCTFDATVQAQNTTSVKFFDGMEEGAAGGGNWNVEDLSGNGNQWVVQGVYPYEGNHSWRAIAPAGSSNQILSMKEPIVVSGNNPQLIFRHYYITEFRWDLGKVEISTNNGSSWTDLGPNFVVNGYNDSVDPNSTSGYANQQAFTGNSGGYILSIADLSAYTGQSVLVRFRLITDDFVGDDGWLIDNIMFVDGVTLENTACLNFEGTTVCDDVSAIIAGPRPEVGVRLKTSAWLQGATDFNETNLMRDDLRAQGFLPQTEPYKNLSAFQHVGSGGGETYANSMVQTEGNDAFVDWVMLELRTKSDPTKVVATKSALITRGGQIVNGLGDDVLFFEDVPNDDYYVCIRHRNHTGILTANPSFLGDYSLATIDFSDTSLPVWGDDNGFIAGNGKRALMTGNIAQTGTIIFQGLQNGPNNIFFEVLSNPNNQQGLLNYIIEGYNSNDVNMDGKVIYQGLNNDANEIFFNILTNPNNTGGFSNYIINEQLPE